MTPRKRRWPLILSACLITLLLCGFAAFQYAIHTLKGRVEAALGPQGEVKEIRVSLTGLEIIGLRIKAPPSTPGQQTDWPAEDQLRSKRILIVPSFIDLLTARISLQTVRIEGAYISMLRSKEGRTLVLPGLLEPQPAPADSQKKGTSGTATPVAIGRIELIDGVIDFHDASVRARPHKLRIEQINATIDKLKLPGLTGFSTINLVGTFKGIRQDGKITISGNAEFTTRESVLTTRLRGIDMTALQPYLIKTTESAVRRGSLDLDLNSTIHKGLLKAPGSLTIKDLELASTSGTVMGIPRGAVVSMMKSRNGEISIKFVLEGNINDPRFSLRENMTTRIGSSLANTLGVSFEGLAKGVGSVSSGTARGIGSTVGKLIGK